MTASTPALTTRAGVSGSKRSAMTDAPTGSRGSRGAKEVSVEKKVAAICNDVLLSGQFFPFDPETGLYVIATDQHRTDADGNKVMPISQYFPRCVSAALGQALTEIYSAIPFSELPSVRSIKARLTA